MKATDAYHGCRGWQGLQGAMQGGAVLSYRMQEAHITNHKRSWG